MYDILPGGANPEPNPRRIKPRVSSRQQKQAVIHAGPRVVQLQWQLPSRLRKPIRDQLRKERAEKRRRQAAAVSFARKEIHTQPLLAADMDSRRQGKRVQKPRRFFNRGVEHNTGDVYSQGKPQLHVAAPPYIGRAMRSKTPAAPAQLGTRRPVQAAKRRPVQAAMVKPAQPRIRQHSAMPIAERDVPISWQGTSNTQPVTEEELFVQVEKPKRIAAGVTFSLWPGNWFGRRESTTPHRLGDGGSMADEIENENTPLHRASAGLPAKAGTPLRSADAELREGSLQRQAKKKRLIF